MFFVIFCIFVIHYKYKWVNPFLNTYAAGG